MPSADEQDRAECFTLKAGDLVVLEEGNGELTELPSLGAEPSKPEPTPNTPGFAIKEAFESLGGVQRNATIARWISNKYPNRWEDRVIGSYLRGCSVNNPIGIKYHPAFPRFLYKSGNGEFELYEPAKHGVFSASGYRQGLAGADTDAIQDVQIKEELNHQEFAYEAHLRDFLARNLALLEAGLRLWTGSEAESVEYALEGRRVDILAKDASGVPVVIELKLSKGHERTLGQALYYRGKLKQLLQIPRVRIIMVAAEITSELRIASSEVSDVTLYQYALTMQVTKV